jgi:hypothetical protein
MCWHCGCHAKNLNEFGHHGHLAGAAPLLDQGYACGRYAEGARHPCAVQHKLTPAPKSDIALNQTAACYLLAVYGW